MEVYLHTFEVIATREAWERERWAQAFTPFLTGDAQRAFYSLQLPQSEAHMGLSPVCAAQLFQQWTYDEHLPIRAQASRLTRLAHLWHTADSRPISLAGTGSRGKTVLPELSSVPPLVILPPSPLVPLPIIEGYPPGYPLPLHFTTDFYISLLIIFRIIEYLTNKKKP